MSKRRKIWLRWDTCDIAREQAKYLMEENPGELSDDEAFSMACRDQDLYEIEWDSLCDALTEQMTRINPHDRPWTGAVRNFGWLHQSGEARPFRADDGKTLLQNVLPHTECTFRIDFDFRKHLITINNAHHDAPMGGEMYYLKPMTRKQYEEWCY